MANKQLNQILTLALGAIFATQLAFASDVTEKSREISSMAKKRDEQAVKLGMTVDTGALLRSYLPDNLPSDAIKKAPVHTSMRAVVGGVNFTSADVDNTMIPFATFNGLNSTALFHDGGEWPSYNGNTTDDDGKGSGESQAREIYDYDGNGHYPKACLRYIGAHCYIFVPIMFFPSLPKSLSSSESETPKAYAEWNMTWAHNRNLYYSPDATSGSVLEPRFVLGADKASAKLALARIADEFDSNIYPKVREYLGTEPDVDGDPKIFLFLDDIRDNTNANLGYFFSGNQLTRSSVPLSNEKEILFLDIHRFYQDRNSIMGTMAHEFSHMVMFNEAYTVENGVLKGLEKWLEEGITTFIEFVYSGKYSPNLDMFMMNPDTILVEDRNTVWNGTNPFANYGASFLWTYYVTEKYGFANIPSFLKAVIRAKVDGGVGNYNAVLKSSNTSMETVFKDWCVANYLDRVYKNDGVTMLNDGKWGYKVDSDKDTSKYIGYTQKLPVSSTDRFTLSKDMNTRSGSVLPWAADYIELSGNTGNLNVAFDGNDNGKFACAVIKKGKSVDTSVDFMYLDEKQCGNLIVQNYGVTGTYENVILVPMMHANYNYERLSYVYSGSFDDLKVAIFPNPLFENYLHIIVRTDKEFASEPRVQMTYEGQQGYLTVSPVNSTTYMTNYTLKTSGEGYITCSGTNKNGVILTNTLKFSATYYPAGSSGSLLAAYAAVDIPVGAMSNSGLVVVSSNDSTTSYEGLTRLSSNVDLAIPVDKSEKALDVSIPVNSSIKYDASKAGLYRATTSGQKWVGPVSIANGKAKGNVDVSASLFVAVDDVPPVIEKETEARGNGRFAVKLNDSGSGICASSVKVFVDGSKVPATASDNEVVVDTTGMRASAKTFDIEVGDNAGNITRASIRASAGATSLKQITAYPNPAKNKSVIRATVTGTNEDNAYGSVKIYDVSGHKVIEGDLENRGSGVYEFNWNLLNKKDKTVANGVYFADVKVGFEGQSHKKRIKIAVLR